MVKKAKKIDSDDLKYKCPACEMSFDTEKERMEHIKAHNNLVKEVKITIDSDDLKYKCPACEMSFDTEKESMEHIKAHNK